MCFLIFISIVIIAVNCVFIWKLIVSFQKKPEALLQSRKDIAAVSVFSFFQFFFSFFGISDFATASIFYSKIKCLATRKIPGTMNASAAIPVAVMAMVFLTHIKMDSTTLLVAMAMQSIGAFFTPFLVAKTENRVIRRFLALSLVIAAVKIFLNDFDITEGTSMGLQGYKLVIFGLLCAFYGFLNNFGIGSFALTTLTAYIIGLNPVAALPIMTCAAAVSIPLACINFIKLGMVSNSVASISTIAGASGVWIAVYIVKNLDMGYVKYVFGAVFIICAALMLTRFWWKSRGLLIDREEQSSKIQTAGLYVIMIAAFLIFLEFIFLGSKIFLTLKDSVIKQEIAPINEFIPELAASLLTFLLFISLLIVSFSRLLRLEIYSHEESKIMCLTDPLTNIANRRAFFEKIHNEWHRLAREQRPLSLLMMDIDKFKDYNDAYGHVQGDELLKAFSAVIKYGARRPADIVARLGGEEFGILLPNTSQEGAIDVAEILRQKVEQIRVPMLDGREPVAITVSIGVATVVPSSKNSYDFLINTADSRLYKAKHAGRNKVCS
jgi:diguanylate cyclase (GGDEF)-like protein